MTFENTPIKSFWYGFKWVTTGVAFLLSLVFLLWSVAIFVSDRADFAVGVFLATLSILLMVYEKSLANSLIEEEQERKRKLEFFERENDDN